MERTKEKKGITLIALIITIIVLLILAGISVATLTGNNSILKQVEKAKKTNALETVKEKVKLEVLSSINTEGKFNSEKFKSNIEKNLENSEIEENNNSILILVDKYEIEVNKNTGEIESTTEIENNELAEDQFTAEKIAKLNMEDLKNIYGAKVTGYELPSTTTTDVGWKILVSNGKNIYLIADNYIERENLPNGMSADGVKTENRPSNGDDKYTRSAYFGNVLNDYSEGTARITDSSLQALNSEFYNKYPLKKNENMKNVAYMMDTRIWNEKFKDINNKADYVIGGPSMELVIKSYNAKYGKNYSVEITQNGDGYGIRSDGKTDYYWGETILDYKDELYVLNNKKEEAMAYWIASPWRGNGNYYVSAIDSSGRAAMGRWVTDGTIAFRPVICLNKRVVLQRENNESFRIK